jgi:hypothetical protein
MYVCVVFKGYENNSCVIVYNKSKVDITKLSITGIEGQFDTSLEKILIAHARLIRLFTFDINFIL